MFTRPRRARASAPRHRARKFLIPVPAALFAGLLVVGAALAAPLLGANAATTTPTSTHANATTAASSTLWSTQLKWDDNGTAWSAASFAALKAKGLTQAEIDMSWNTVEPAQNTFNYTELDQEIANANAAGIHLVLIFWYSGWNGSPASWVTSHETTASGAQSATPVWWDPTDEPAYLTYVTDTVKHVAGEAGYGGSILDYGRLDSVWDSTVSGQVDGWAQADVNEFHNVYLPQTYTSIGAFNSANKTSYTTFAQVPAATPGQPLASVYQLFREWSVQQVYGQLTADVRAVSASTPLYYYFGGHVGNFANYENVPEVFFALAKKYGVTVIQDCSESTGIDLLFAALGRAYGVNVATEWTAPSDSTQLAAQAVQWIGNYPMMLPEGGGTDFFIHDGTQKDTVAYPIYTAWLANLKGLSGSYPQQPVAVYLDDSLAYGNTSGGALGAPENSIASLWDGYQAGFSVVTSEEVDTGVVKLSQYQAVLPINGVDGNLTAYKNGGGHLLTASSQLSGYAPAYATLASSGVLQIVPVVDAAKTGAQLTLADISSSTAYSGAVTVHPAGLGLASGTYHLVDATGKAMAQEAVSGGICASANVAAASLAEWSVVAGAAPAGTPTPAGCGTGTPPSCGALTANQQLAAGASVASCNGTYRLTLQSDGNLVLYKSGTALWSSGTTNSGATHATMQGDGNLVLATSAGTAVWSTKTAGNTGAYLDVQNDGNTVLYSAAGASLWSTGTAGK
ncbi:glycoside hydrolase family 42 [Streptacidiphilus pinicola]|uniref:Glycoside hydrolase family 42 n=1 Tax=Streptacidiphilus pinicola TaxID=2219663 RepID=A0A2X0KF88_9ACTN|nr:beta-galactosidase [Streptacidiphilus pinicola]RAG85510.1 glycoside hydrolase family 42 [Streptacidiphilus pinicola]